MYMCVVCVCVCVSVYWTSLEESNSLEGNQDYAKIVLNLYWNQKFLQDNTFVIFHKKMHTWKNSHGALISNIITFTDIFAQSSRA